MVAFFALLAKPAIAGLIKWGIGALVTYSIAKTGIEAFGSTPNNRAEKLGVSNQDIHDYSRKDKQDKLDFLKEKYEERCKETKEENEKLREDLKKLEKRLLTEMEEWKDELDPAEKARKLATMKETQGEIEGVKGQIKKNDNQIKQDEKDIAKVFDELSKGAEKLSIEQTKAKNNAPDLGSWLNWGIITIGVITAVLIVKFIFGMFKKFNKEIG